MANVSTEQYIKTYTTFGGSDIVATFNGKVIGELQAITYSITREKVPVYTMGSAEPRSFSMVTYLEKFCDMLETPKALIPKQN